MYVCVCVCESASTICLCTDKLGGWGLFYSHLCTHLSINLPESISSLSLSFTSSPGEETGVLSQVVIPKIPKMVNGASLLNTQRYKVRIKSKRSNPGKRIAPSSPPRCSSYWKGSLWAVLDYNRPTYVYKLGNYLSIYLSLLVIYL